VVPPSTTPIASGQDRDGLSTDPSVPILHAETVGAGPRVVLAHGFTQTGRLWNSVDRLLAADHQVVSVDMPGHAGSSHVAADLVEGAHLLGAAGGRGAYVGYSMGARFCLHLALARPDLVGSLVLISGTAGLDRPGDRSDRRASDESLAFELDPPPHLDGTSGLRSIRQARLDAFLHRWLDNPLLAGIEPEANGFDERRRNTGPGLASSLRLAGTGTQQPLWDLLCRLEMPVLVMTGEYDDKFTGIGRRMVTAIGANATQAVVPHTGHSPHLQEPTLVAELISQHLDPPQPLAGTPPGHIRAAGIESARGR
jgi:2-succinyl-6-hydroxy-2,4-cyclohexadiene-1-carboxylate synthase